ncbi:MAG: hypothetical protein EDM05_000445 (plasmid) [Leptolyngbya sp. IPPAS B-1204]
MALTPEVKPEAGFANDLGADSWIRWELVWLQEEFVIEIPDGQRGIATVPTANRCIQMAA